MTQLEFACSDCDQSFNMRIKLKKHAKVHTKEQNGEFLNRKEDWTDEEKVIFARLQKT